jgi:hypothetical protein
MNQNTIDVVEVYGQPTPSTHFDERMNWTLKDVTRLFPTGKFTAFSLTGRNKEIMRGE